MNKQITFVDAVSSHSHIWTPTIEEFNRQHVYMIWERLKTGHYFILGVELCMIREIINEPDSNVIKVTYEAR